MGYFDALAASAIAERDDGSARYYPWGFLGEGYELPDAEKREQVRGFMKRFYRIFVPLCALMGGAVGFLVPFAMNEDVSATILWIGVVATLLVVAGGLGLYAMRVRRLTRGLGRTGGRPSILGSFQRQAEVQSRRTLWVFLVFSVLFVLLNLWLLFDSESGRWLSVLGLVFFCASSALWGYQLRLKRQQAEEPQESSP